MAWTEGHFESFDGTQLFYRFFKHKESRATLVILHGHGEHSGRYVKFAQHLNDLKISLAVMEFRGHGQSEGRRVFIRDFSDYLGDAAAFVAFLDKNYHLESKFLLFGHSFGGLVAAHLALQMRERVCALFLSSPCFGLRLPSFLIGLNHAIGSLFPGFVYQNPIYPPYLTHNTAEIENYKKDGLIQRKMTPSLLTAMLAAMKKFEGRTQYDYPFPVFVLMSGMEKVVDADKTRLFFDRVQAPLKDLKVFDGFYHEIFNELGQEKVFDALREDIRRCL